MTDNSSVSDFTECQSNKIAAADLYATGHLPSSSSSSIVRVKLYCYRVSLPLRVMVWVIMRI